MFIQNSEKGIFLNLSIRPNTQQTKIQKIEDDRLYIDISAVPDKNKANKELIGFLSDLFCVSKSNIEIVTGLKSRNKRVRVKDKAEEEILKAISEVLEEGGKTK